MMKMLYSNEEILTAYLNSEIREGIEKEKAEVMEKGIEKGKEETLLSSIKNIMDSFGVSLERALEALNIPKSEYSKYAEIFNCA